MKRLVFVAALGVALWLGLFVLGAPRPRPAGSAGGLRPLDQQPEPLPLPETSAEAAFLIGGIQIDEPDTVHWLDRLRGAGFNAVSLTAYARHAAWNGSELDWDRDPSWLVPEMRAARQRGLRLVMIVRVALDHGLAQNRFLWHGMIMPKSEHEVRAFFANYTEYVLQWARVAEREGVSVLGIGSELNALAATAPAVALPGLEAYYLDPATQALERARYLRAAAALPAGALERQLTAGWGETYDRLDAFIDDRSSAHAAWAEETTGGGSLASINARRALLLAEWRQLVAAVRACYRGRLTYAANFDQYQGVGFWDQLDAIGINAYFPLRADLVRRSDAEQGWEFERAWRRVLDEIDGWRRERALTQLPVLFTELGYTRAFGGTLEPWAGGGLSLLRQPGGRAELVVWNQQPPAPRERALAVRALFDVARARPAAPPLAGLLYWKFSTVEEHAAIEPFVLVLGQADPLERELLRFADLPRSP